MKWIVKTVVLTLLTRVAQVKFRRTSSSGLSDAPPAFQCLIASLPGISVHLWMLSSFCSLPIAGECSCRGRGRGVLSMPIRSLLLLLLLLYLILARGKLDYLEVSS